MRRLLGPNHLNIKGKPDVFYKGFNKIFGMLIIQRLKGLNFDF